MVSSNQYLYLTSTVRLKRWSKEWGEQHCYCSQFLFLSFLWFKHMYSSVCLVVKSREEGGSSVLNVTCWLTESLSQQLMHNPTLSHWYSREFNWWKCNFLLGHPYTKQRENSNYIQVLHVPQWRINNMHTCISLQGQVSLWVSDSSD